MKINIRRFIRPALLLIWTVACFCFFQSGFKYHFYFLEQNQLFLLSGAYLAEFFNEPSWLSSMAGEFLQQFYHYPSAGAAILTVSLLLMGDAFFRALRRILPDGWNKGTRNILSLLTALVIMTLEARCFIYENAQLSSVLSLAGSAALWTIMDLIRVLLQKKAGKFTLLLFTLVFVLSSMLCYWLFGYGLLVMLALELLYYLFIKRIPVPALAAIAVAALLAGPVCKHYRMEKKEALLCPGPGKWIKIAPARKVETMLEYYVMYKRGAYKEIVMKYETSKEKKFKELTLIYSLALSQYGMLADRFTNMKEPMIGTSVHLGHASSYIVSMIMTELYYLIGDMTYAERGCMHVNNFSIHKRSSVIIQKLVEIELVSGDYEAAAKYLTMLKKSPVYRKWAEDHTPETMSDEVRAAIEAKRKTINTRPEVRVSDNCRTMLLGLLDSNRDNVIALDYLLCTDIIEGRAQDFLDDYEKYGPREKKLYLQALMQLKTRRR